MLDELMPILKSLSQQPIAFMGGFVSGMLRLNLQDDPVKRWLDQQAGGASARPAASQPSNGHGPQSITID